MHIKHISLTLLLIFAPSIKGDACASEVTEPQCTGHVAKERHPLFTQAEQHEQNFINALAQCRQANNCLKCPQFVQAATTVAEHIVALDKHLENLAQGTDGVCNICERTETDDIKNHLVKVLFDTPEIANVFFQQ